MNIALGVASTLLMQSPVGRMSGNIGLATLEQKLNTQRLEPFSNPPTKCLGFKKRRHRTDWKRKFNDISHREKAARDWGITMPQNFHRPTRFNALM
ncbi:hypothetical protein [Nostoc sp. FACHB-888]|uniref:hypothetical protein n=1 Tax=Nostoc sp. FACHB-888 TaxID=2692842 RepID=UPI00168465CE|nr:hypothetical protein [Nostoc sp. FACHB-888]MBD2247065.1 hypothetical protein [Nostoc sp. FACHB-888]